MFSVQEIQFFKYVNKVQIDDVGNHEDQISYSANVAISVNGQPATFMIQCDGDSDSCRYSFPRYDDAFWTTVETQEAAYTLYSIDEIVSEIESNGFENNEFWLEENGEKMN